MEKVFENPLISIIVPIYNVEAYLNKCVDSILNQTYNNLEIILVDDGGMDNCPKICDDYAKKDKRIRVIHKQNGGLSDARNKGIDIAKGDYLTFIDSDDYVSTNYVKELYELVKDNSTDIGIASHYIVENNIKKRKYNSEKLTLNSHDVLDRMLYDEGIDVSAWAKIYKRELFDKVRYPVGRLYEDAATFYQFVMHSKIIKINNIPIYYYIVRKNSIAQDTFSIKKMDLIKSTEEMTNSIRRKYPDLASGCERRLMYSYLSTLSQLTKSKKEDKRIKKQLMRYIKKNRFKVIKDKRIPNRDRIALLTTYLGYYFFKLSWKLYGTIKKRG